MGKKYSITVHNRASHSACLTVFQNDPTQWSPHAMPLAWFAKFSRPQSRIRFEWGDDLGFSWAETGELRPGMQFCASETYHPAGGNNQISLAYNGAYHFVNPEHGPDAAGLHLAGSGSIPARSQAAVGVTMSGSTVYATQARPDQNLTFSPQPQYFIAYGNYEEGEVIDVSTILNPLQLSYPAGIYALTTTLHADGTWDQPISLAQANQERMRLFPV